LFAQNELGTPVFYARKGNRRIIQAVAGAGAQNLRQIGVGSCCNALILKQGLWLPAYTNNTHEAETIQPFQRWRFRFGFPAVFAFSRGFC
jgi:hypothetical protein